MIVCPGPHDWTIEIGLFHFFSSIGSCLVDMYAKCKRMEICLKVVQHLWCGLLNHPSMHDYATWKCGKRANDIGTSL
jgi:hypothetical protein